MRPWPQPDRILMVSEQVDLCQLVMAASERSLNPVTTAGAARRLIQAGAVRINGKAIRDNRATISKTSLAASYEPAFVPKACREIGISTEMDVTRGWIEIGKTTVRRLV